MSTDNILKVWGKVDDVDRREGMVAYERYHATMNSIASYYSVPLASVVGAFCALSPNNDYQGNLRSLVSVIQGYIRGVPAERITISTYNHCKTRALACMAGEDFTRFTKGLKTLSFFMNIMYPWDAFPVTIDGHMYCVWAGKRITMKQVAYERFDYSRVADDFRAVAKQVQVLPNQVQGILWFTWKRINKVLFNPQLDLFAGGGDFWGLLPEPEHIRPYPVKEA